MKIETYNIEACLDVAREHKWIPSTRLTIESDDEGVDTPLSTMGLMAIKAQ